ncbi:hypothetical protein NUSPORA_00293 [Nucleospora cyclopteri]
MDDSFFENLNALKFEEKDQNTSFLTIPLDGIKKYLKIRNILQKELEIKNVQQKISTKIFNKKKSTKFDFFFYNKENYIIESDSEEIESYESISEEKNEVIYAQEKKYEEKESHKKRIIRNNLIDNEAFCSDDNSEEEDESEGDLEDFIDKDENETNKFPDHLQFEIEENRREIEGMERKLMKKYYRNKQIRIEEELSEHEIHNINSSCSSEIEEIDLNEEFNTSVLREEKIEQKKVVRNTKHFINVEKGMKFDSEAVKRRLGDNYKKVFKGFK